MNTGGTAVGSRYASALVSDDKADRDFGHAVASSVPLWVREHRQRQAQQRAQAAVVDDNDLILATRNGRPINQRNLSRVWRRVTERAGVEHRGIHHLRHTYGTTLAEHGSTNASPNSCSGIRTATSPARSTPTSANG